MTVTAEDAEVLQGLLGGAQIVHYDIDRRTLSSAPVRPAPEPLIGDRSLEGAAVQASLGSPTPRAGSPASVRQCRHARHLPTWRMRVRAGHLHVLRARIVVPMHHGAFDGKKLSPGASRLLAGEGVLRSSDLEQLRSRLAQPG